MGLTLMALIIGIAIGLIWGVLIAYWRGFHEGWHVCDKKIRASFYAHF